MAETDWLVGEDVEVRSHGTSVAEMADGIAELLLGIEKEEVRALG